MRVLSRGGLIKRRLACLIFANSLHACADTVRCPLTSSDLPLSVAISLIAHIYETNLARAPSAFVYSGWPSTDAWTYVARC